MTCWRCGNAVPGRECRYCTERERLASGPQAKLLPLTSREVWALIFACLLAGYAIGRFL